MRSRNHAVYVISVAAELAGMHPQTLRIYERRGLVQPARTQGGNRRYSDVDIERLRRIQDLAAGGMNLEGIRRVMELEHEVEQLVRSSPAVIARNVGIAQAAQLRRAGRPHEADEVVVIKGRIYVRGHVKHPDHATLFLRTWRRTFGNTEASQPEGVLWVD